MVINNFKVLFTIGLIAIILMNCNHSIYDKIKSIKEMPYVPDYSGDPIFWEVVKEGIEIVPELIDHLDDTTHTKIFVPLFSGTYKIGNDLFIKDFCLSAT